MRLRSPLLPSPQACVPGLEQPLSQDVPAQHIAGTTLRKSCFVCAPGDSSMLASYNHASLGKMSPHTRCPMYVRLPCSERAPSELLGPCSGFKRHIVNRHFHLSKRQGRLPGPEGANASSFIFKRLKLTSATSGEPAAGSRHESIAYLLLHADLETRSATPQKTHDSESTDMRMCSRLSATPRPVACSILSRKDPTE